MDRRLIRKASAKRLTFLKERPNTNELPRLASDNTLTVTLPSATATNGFNRTQSRPFQTSSSSNNNNNNNYNSGSPNNYQFQPYDAQQHPPSSPPEKPQSGLRFSVSATNLKIKKAHATTLSDFYSAQKQMLIESYKPPRKTKTSTQSIRPSIRNTQTSEQKLRQTFMKEQLLLQAEQANPLSLYNRTSKRIVQTILNQSDANIHHDDPNLAIQGGGTPEAAAAFGTQNTSQKHKNQKKGAGQFVARTSEDTIDPRQEGTKKVVQFNEKLTNSSSTSAMLTAPRKLAPPPTQPQPLPQPTYPQSQSQMYRLGPPSSQQSQGINHSQDSRGGTRHNYLPERPINVPAASKFYCLSSVGFKNYKYPRPQVIPYDHQAENRTRMPLYLMPQSAPSQRIEDICIGKFKGEIAGLQQTIEESNAAGNYVPPMLYDVQQKYESDIEYIERRANQQLASDAIARANKIKNNAKYTFSDSKSKALNTLSLRNSRIEDISDMLFRTKNKVIGQINRTQSDLVNLSSFLQSSQLGGGSAIPSNQLITLTAKQLNALFKDLVSKSDALKDSKSKNSLAQDAQRNSYIQEEAEEEIQGDSFYPKTLNLVDDDDHHHRTSFGVLQDNTNNNYSGQYSHRQKRFTQQDEGSIQVQNVEEPEDVITGIQSLATLNQLKLLQEERDLIIKPKSGELVVGILVENFTVLSANRPALRDRILLALGLNPQDDFCEVSKQQFELFHTVLVSKSSFKEVTVDFILKFFDLNIDEEEEDDNENEEEYEPGELESKPNQKPKRKGIISKLEFKRVLRLLTISIDEKAKPNEKSLFDYMMENLILTEVINDDFADLAAFKVVLLSEKINPKDIIDLICNLL